MINLNRGETKDFQIAIRGQITGNPVDLTGATEIVVAFPAGSNPDVDLTLTGARLSYPVDALLGVVQGTVRSTESPLFDLGQGQLVTMTVTKPSGISIYKGQILNVNG